MACSFCSFCRHAICAQEVSVKLGIADSIQSERLNEMRKLIIHLPDGYDTSNEPRPVLYLPGGSRSKMPGKARQCWGFLCFRYKLFGSTCTEALSPTTVVHSRTRHEVTSPFTTYGSAFAKSSAILGESP